MLRYGIRKKCNLHAVTRSIRRDLGCDRLFARVAMKSCICSSYVTSIHNQPRRHVFQQAANALEILLTPFLTVLSVAATASVVDSCGNFPKHVQQEKHHSAHPNNTPTREIGQHLPQVRWGGPLVLDGCIRCLCAHECVGCLCFCSAFA